MTVVNLNQKTSGGAASGDRPILPSDIYRMKIVDAQIEDNTLDKPNRDGSFKKQLAITWEVSALTDEQEAEAEERSEKWIGVRVWQRIGLYYGDVRDGGPSKLKAFIDKFRAAGHLPNFDLDAFDIDELVDVEMRVTIQEYIKTMGVNAGQPGNKVTDVSALRTRGALKTKNKPVPVSEEEEKDLF